MHSVPRFPLSILVLAGALVLAVTAGLAPADAGIDFWTPLGPNGGDVIALTATPAQPGLLYAATSNAGVFRSEDGGSTWVHPSGSPWFGAEALIADPQAPGTVYAIAGGNLEKSADAGNTWMVPTTGLVGPFLALAIDPQSSATLYASTGNSVVKSTDGVVSWNHLATGSGYFNAVAVDPSLPSTVYAVDPGSPLKFLRSADSGATWVERDLGLPLSGVDFYPPPLIAVDPATVPGTVYVAFRAAGVAAVYRSADAGDSWQAAGPGGYPLALGRGVIYAGGVKSTDGGVTWTPATASPGTASLSAAAPGSGTTRWRSIRPTRTGSS